MEMGELESTGEGEDERDEVVVRGGGGYGYLVGGDGGRWYAAGKGGVVVYVEFKEVEEGVVYGFEGAIDV